MLFVIAADAAAVTLRVGNDAACTHATIQAAIDASIANGPDEDEILLAQNKVYAAQALVIAAPSDGEYILALVAGGATCVGGATATPTVLSGAGNGGLPILRVLNPEGDLQHYVNLLNLDLVDGGGPSTDGGAVRVEGAVTMSLIGTQVRNNTAARGGGLYLVGRGPSHGAYASLFPSHAGDPPRRSVIQSNQAIRGGGVYLDHDAHGGFNAEPIVDNRADFGGGLYIAALGEPGLYVAPDAPPQDERGLRRNRARFDGGGLYVESLLSFGVSSQGPGAHFPIVDNEAGRDGGGVFATGAGTHVNLYSVYVDGNRAGTEEAGCGGGLYAGGKAAITLNGGPSAGVCLPQSPCASLTNNVAGDGSSSGMGGGACLRSAAEITLIGTDVRGNRAAQGAAVDAESFESRAILDSVLIVDSSGIGSTLAARDDAFLQPVGMTLTDDLTQAALIDLDDAKLGIDYSIVYQPGREALARRGVTTVLARCVLSHQDFEPAGDVRVDDPRFVDSAADDYPLAIDSPAIDACQDIVFRETDLRAQHRGIDLPEVANNGGAYDLGARERQIPPEIFANGFE